MLAYNPVGIFFLQTTQLMGLVISSFARTVDITNWYFSLVGVILSHGADALGVVRVVKLI